MALATLLALDPQSSWILAAVLLTLTTIALLLFGFTPTATRIAGGQLQIASPLRTWTIPMESIVRTDPATLNPWTNSPPFRHRLALAPNGWLWSRTYGRFQAHANSRHDLYMLHLRDGSRVLVSLHDATLRTSLTTLLATHQEGSCI